MQAIDQLTQDMEQQQWHELSVSKALSVATLLKETHRALNENRESFYRIPSKQKTIAQELLIFANAGGSDLHALTDDNLSRARVTLKLPWSNANAYARFVDDVHQHAEHLLPKSNQVIITGMMALLGKTLHGVMQTTVISYLIAFSGIS